MITLSVDICNPISQKFYDDIISSLQFHQLTCTCGCSGCLTGHGYYTRSLKTDGTKIKLHICRVKCKACGCTHAILLSNIVPYSQIPLEDQVDVISDYLKSNDGVSIMERNPEIDENNIQSVIRQYRHHWKQRLLAVRVSMEPISTLIKQCFSLFNRQFMQIKSTPNILFLRPT